MLTITVAGNSPAEYDDHLKYSVSALKCIQFSETDFVLDFVVCDVGEDKALH
jgi:hypothetical protein